MEQRQPRPKIRSFKDLIAWQKGMDLVDLVYRVTAKFPRHELFGLVLQMRKAAVSIPSNTAEGYGRRRLGDYQRFLDIARGSLCELQTQAIVSHRQKYVDETDDKVLESLMDEVGRLLYGLSESLPPAQ